MLEMQPPRDVQQNADERMAAAPEILLSDEEPDPPDPKEDWLPGSPEPRESAEAVRKQLLEKFKRWNSGNKVKKPVPKCLVQEGQWLLPTCMPAWLSQRDDRFHVSKKAAGLRLRHT